MGGFPCENPLGSRWKLVTPQIRNTSDVCFPDPFQRLSDIHGKDPAIEENRVFWGCNIRRISVEYGYSLQSDKHQLPIIRWVLIDGLNELGDCLPHEIRLVNVILVTDGGHLVFENDG